VVIRDQSTDYSVFVFSNAFPLYMGYVVLNGRDCVNDELKGSGHSLF
jgi:hypothetical protein